MHWLYCNIFCHGWWCRHGADSSFAPSQWETSLQSNAVSHWLGANQESSLRHHGDSYMNSHIALLSTLVYPYPTEHSRRLTQPPTPIAIMLHLHNSVPVTHILLEYILVMNYAIQILCIVNFHLMPMCSCCYSFQGKRSVISNSAKQLFHYPFILFTYKRRLDLLYIIRSGWV